MPFCALESCLSSCTDGSVCERNIKMKNRPRAAKSTSAEKWPFEEEHEKLPAQWTDGRTGPHIVCALACAQQRQIDCAVSELRWSILMMGRETNSGKCSAGGATADWRVMNPHQLAHRRRSVITPPARSLALYPAASKFNFGPCSPTLQFTRTHAHLLVYVCSFFALFFPVFPRRKDVMQFENLPCSAKLGGVFLDSLMLFTSESNFTKK